MTSPKYQEPLPLLTSQTNTERTELDVNWKKGNRICRIYLNIRYIFCITFYGNHENWIRLNPTSVVSRADVVFTL